MALKGQYIDRSPVESAAILSAGYHPDTRTLAVEFKNKVYHLLDVSQEEADAFMASESKGKHYREHLGGKEAQSVYAPKMGTCEKCGGKGLTGFLCQDCGTYDYA